MPPLACDHTPPTAAELYLSLPVRSRRRRSFRLSLCPAATMGEHFPSDGAAANGFGRRTLHEWEAHLLFEANILTPPNMRAPGRWKLSTGGVAIPPLPDIDVRPDYFADEVDRVRVSLMEEQQALPQYATSNHEAWAEYF